MRRKRERRTRPERFGVGYGWVIHEGMDGFWVMTVCSIPFGFCFPGVLRFSWCFTGWLDGWRFDEGA